LYEKKAVPASKVQQRIRLTEKLHIRQTENRTKAENGAEFPNMPEIVIRFLVTVKEYN
jgi:hypothetical protein